MHFHSKETVINNYLLNPSICPLFTHKKKAARFTSKCLTLSFSTYFKAKLVLSLTSQEVRSSFQRISVLLVSILLHVIRLVQFTDTAFFMNYRYEVTSSL